VCSSHWRYKRGKATQKRSNTLKTRPAWQQLKGKGNFTSAKCPKNSKKPRVGVVREIE